MSAIGHDRPSTLAQAVLDWSLAIPETTAAQRLAVRLIESVRQRLSRRGNPLIRYELDGHKLLMPLSHNLPLYRKHNCNYSSNLGRIAQQIAKFHPGAAAIDIGANIGDSVAIIRGQCNMPVLCIEGDPEFLRILHANLPALGQDVYIFGGFVATETGPLQAAIRSDGGSAHLEQGSGAGATIQAKSLQDILLQFPQFQSPRLLKIDTDGFDVAILRGALPMLRQEKPVLFFEYDPYYLSANGDNGLAALRQLSEIGYVKALVYDNFGDLMLTTDLKNEALLQELDAYFSGRRGKRYMDLCLFAESDLPLYESLRSAESLHFSRRR